MRVQIAPQCPFESDRRYHVTVEIVRLDKRPAILSVRHASCRSSVTDPQGVRLEWQAAIERGMSDKQVRGAVTKTLATVYRRMLIARASA